MILHEKDFNRYGYTISRIEEVGKEQYSCMIKNGEQLFSGVIKKAPFCNDYRVISVDKNFINDFRLIVRTIMMQSIFSILTRFILQIAFFTIGTVIFYTTIFFTPLKFIPIGFILCFACAWLFLHTDSFIDAISDVIHGKKVNYVK